MLFRLLFRLGFGGDLLGFTEPFGAALCLFTHKTLLRMCHFPKSPFSSYGAQEQFCNFLQDNYNRWGQIASPPQFGSASWAFGASPTVLRRVGVVCIRELAASGIHFFLYFRRSSCTFPKPLSTRLAVLVEVIITVLAVWKSPVCEGKAGGRAGLGFHIEHARQAQCNYALLWQQRAQRN